MRLGQRAAHPTSTDRPTYILKPLPFFHPSSYFFEPNKPTSSKPQKLGQAPHRSQDKQIVRDTKVRPDQPSLAVLRVLLARIPQRIQDAAEAPNDARRSRGARVHQAVDQQGDEEAGVALGEVGVRLLRAVEAELLARCRGLGRRGVGDGVGHAGGFAQATRQGGVEDVDEAGENGGSEDVA